MEDYSSLLPVPDVKIALRMFSRDLDLSTLGFPPLYVLGRVSDVQGETCTITHAGFEGPTRPESVDIQGDLLLARLTKRER